MTAQPAERISPTDVTILKLAVRGRGAGFISEAVSVTAEQVSKVLARHGGTKERWQWAVDEATRDVVPRRTDGPPGPSRPSPPPPRPASIPAPPATRPQAPNVAAPGAGRLELMLARAGRYDQREVVTARNAVLAACTRLEGALQKTERKQRDQEERRAAKAAAKARVELCEKQLREARAALRGNRRTASKSVVPAPTEDRGEDPRRSAPGRGSTR